MDGAILDREVGPMASHTAGQPSRPLRVGVLVDLALSAEAGGHVKCWERIAEAATGFADRLDLTVHFNAPIATAGDAGVPQRIELSPSVRYVLMPSMFSTRRLLTRIPDHTDLAPWHPGLARALPDYDVIHTTDAFFCYSRTASRFARRNGVPLVSSFHTNTPEYARLTVESLLAHVLGHGAAYRLASERLALPRWVSRVLEGRLHRHLASATMVMASYGGALDATIGRHCGVALRRGLDRALFTPAKRDRAWLETRFGLPPRHFILIYAGKLNKGKNVQLLGPAVARARQGRPIHLLCAGVGDLCDTLRMELGGAVTLPGVLSQDELARAYASADLFLFPSMIDEAGNAPMEALASGLPALLARGSGVSARMDDCAAVRVLPGDAPDAWASAIVEFATDPEQCGTLGHLARAYIEAEVPSWAEVLSEDLLPVWQEAAATRCPI
jgi:glycosyltransferase involved in cell wall biosynthesis